jgi:hypothetical protein
VTKEELSDVLRRIGWSSTYLAGRLGIQETTVRRWLSGHREVPPNVGEWLEEVATLMDKAPPLPRGWQRPGE